jgi:serine protease Do
MKRFILLSLSCIFLTFDCSAAIEAKPKSFTEVAKKSIPAVVSIRVKASTRINRQSENDDDILQYFFGIPRQSSPRQPVALGQASGFIISPDGYILTNSHVVRDADEILVTTNDDKEYKGKVIGLDPQTDLAVVKIDAQNLPFLKLGNSDELEVAQPVMAIGAPLGLRASVSVGVVSAKGRNNLDILPFEDYIQTDAAINRGNSGGPLINEEGEVVGINTAIVTSNENGGYMGIGFAIPSSIAQHIMEQLISTGDVTRGFMGVTLQQVDQDLATAFGQEHAEGALISDVAKGSPAEKAGLKQGDIITKYNNQRAANITALRNAIAMMKPGTKVNLTVLRSGKVLTIPIEIGSFPTAFVASRENKLGFEVEPLSPEIARTLGLVNEQGVVISKVEQGSPAAWAGIKKGTLLIAVNHQKVNSIADVNEALSKAESGKPVLLLVKQGEATRFISLKVN